MNGMAELLQFLCNNSFSETIQKLICEVFCQAKSQDNVFHKFCVLSSEKGMDINMRISVFFDHILQAKEQTGKLLSTLLEGVRAAGIEAVEINLQYLMEHTEVISYLEQADLQISCIYDFYEMDRLDETLHMTKHIEMANKVGAENILVVPGFLSEQEALEMQSYKNEYEAMSAFLNRNEKILLMLQQMRVISKMGTEHQINVTIEDFDDVKSPVSSINGIRYFLEQVSNLKYTLDMGNFVYNNEDVLEAWEILKYKVVHVHCKDRGAVLEENKMQELDYNINGANRLDKKHINRGLLTVAVGDGYMPISELVEKIKETGYSGYFVIEHFDAPNQEEYMRRSTEFLKGCICV